LFESPFICEGAFFIVEAQTYGFPRLWGAAKGRQRIVLNKADACTKGCVTAIKM